MANDSKQRILIDTNVLIFSLLPEKLKVDVESSKEQYAYFQSRNAKEFLLKCQQNLREVCVSSISLSEIMKCMTDDDAREVFSRITHCFTILPFDVNASFQAGRLAFSLHQLDTQKSSEKTKIRNDIYILATGLQHNCTDFYTTDNVLIKQTIRLSIPMKVHVLPVFEEE